MKIKAYLLAILSIGLVSEALADSLYDPHDLSTGIIFVGDANHGRLYPGDKLGDNNTYLTYQNDGDLVFHFENADPNGPDTVSVSNTGGTCPGYASVHANYGLAIFDCNESLIWTIRNNANEPYPYTNFMLEVGSDPVLPNDPNVPPSESDAYYKLYNLDTERVNASFSSYYLEGFAFYQPGQGPQITNDKARDLWGIAGFSSINSVENNDLDDFQESHDGKSQGLGIRIFNNFKTANERVWNFFDGDAVIAELTDELHDDAIAHYCDAFFSYNPDDCHLWGSFDDFTESQLQEAHDSWCQKFFTDPNSCDVRTFESAEEALEATLMEKYAAVAAPLTFIATINRLNDKIESGEVDPINIFNQLMSSVLQIPEDEIPIYDSLAGLFNSALSSDNRGLGESQYGQFWWEGNVASMLGRNENIQYDIAGAEITFTLKDLMSAVWEDVSRADVIALPGFNLLQLKGFITWPKYIKDDNVAKWEFRLRLADVGGVKLGGVIGQDLQEVTGLGAEADVVGAHEWRWLYSHDVANNENSYDGHKYNSSLNAIGILSINFGEMIKKLIDPTPAPPTGSAVGLVPDEELTIDDLINTPRAQILQSHFVEDIEVELLEEFDVEDRLGLSIDELRSMETAYSGLSPEGQTLFNRLHLEEVTNVDWNREPPINVETPLSNVLEEIEPGIFDYQSSQLDQFGNPAVKVELIDLNPQEQYVLSESLKRDYSSKKALAWLLTDGVDIEVDMTELETAELAKYSKFLSVMGTILKVAGGNNLAALGCGIGTTYNFDMLDGLPDGDARKQVMKRSVYLSEFITDLTFAGLGEYAAYKLAQTSPQLADVIAPKLNTIGNVSGAVGGYFVGDEIARDYLDLYFNDVDGLYESSWACYVFGEYKPWGDVTAPAQWDSSVTATIPTRLGLAGALDARFNYQFAGSKIDFSDTPTARFLTPGNVYEAENATTSHTVINDVMASGEKAVYWNNAGELEWTVNVPEAGDYRLRIGYALASGSSVLNLHINDYGYSEPDQFISFNATGNMTNYDVINHRVRLNAGNNLIALKGENSVGLTLDFISLSDAQYVESIQPVSSKQIDTFQGDELLAGADLAIDGTTDGAWSWTNNSVSHTQSTSNTWWQADLGTAHDVTSVTVYNRVGCCPDRAAGFYILVSDFDVEGLTLAQARAAASAEYFEDGTVPSEIGNSKRIYNFSQGTTGRYITIYKPGNSYLSLAEVKIQGISKPIGEAGVVNAQQESSDQWHQVNLRNTYSDPVVIMNVPSSNGPDSMIIRLRNVTGNSFEWQMDEWEYGDGGHEMESVGYFVVESGIHTLGDGGILQAGTSSVNHNWANLLFPQSYEEVPVVVTQSQSYNGIHSIVTRQRNSSESGFSVRIQEEEANDGWHTWEDIGWVAVNPGIFTVGNTTLEVNTTGNQVTHFFYGVPFAYNFEEEPAFIGSMQTFIGHDPAALRMQYYLGMAGLDLRIDEEMSLNVERDHIAENVGYIAVTPGSIVNDVVQ